METNRKGQERRKRLAFSKHLQYAGYSDEFLTLLPLLILTPSQRPGEKELSELVRFLSIKEGCLLC